MMTGTRFGILAAQSESNRSMDFERSSSQSLSMSSGNWGSYDRAKHAFSVWFKRESTGSVMDILTKENEFHIRLTLGNELEHRGFTSGGALNGLRTTSPTYTSTSQFYHLLVHFDSANATPANRMRMWVDGSEVSSYLFEANPTTSVHSDTTSIALGASTGGSNFFDGLIYQPAFFSGSLPSIGQVYNAGSPVDVSSLPGLWSLLKTNASGALVDDYVLAADWTNNNTVIKSTTIP